MKTIRWKRLLLILLIAYMIVAAVWLSVKKFHEQEIDRQAQQWLNRASEIATPELTPDQARQWLRSNGFTSILQARELVEPEPKEASVRKEEEYWLVVGWQKVSEGGPLWRPAWVEIAFLFTPDQKKFVRVTSDIRREPPPFQEAAPPQG
jgi:hypothetical protein